MHAVFGFAKSWKEQEKMKTPTAFVPNECVHFVYFVFGGQIRSPNIVELVHSIKHCGNTIAKNIYSGAKTVVINDTKRLGLLDNR